MSAPHSIGRHRYGVANVLSTISGTPCSCATAATASMSSTLPPGLPIVSAKNAFVFGRTASRQADGSSGSTQVSSTSILRSMCLSWFTVPPYSADDDTTWSPGSKQREQRRGLRGDAAGERDCPGTALEARDALLEGRDGRVHDPGVGVAVLLEVEVGGRGLRVLEHVAGRLEDRHRSRAGVRVGTLPGVELARLEPERPCLLGARVIEVSSRKRRTIGVCRPPRAGSSRGRRAHRSRGARPACPSAERLLDLARSGRRVEPVGAERDQQRSRADACQGSCERALAVLTGEVEVGQRSRRVEVGVRVEPSDERIAPGGADSSRSRTRAR